MKRVLFAGLLTVGLSGCEPAYEESVEEEEVAVSAPGAAMESGDTAATSIQAHPESSAADAPDRAMTEEAAASPAGNSEVGPPGGGDVAGPIPLGSKLEFTPPEGWSRQQPRSSMVESEFAIEAAEGDKDRGRATVMSAQGTIEANIQRWQEQFSERPEPKVEKIEAAGKEITMVDLAGTYKDQPGPFAPAVERPGYRMLAAIIPTDDRGNYFIKFYGPEKTVAANEQAFRQLIASIKPRQ